MSDKCTSPEREYDPLDLANRMFSLAEMADHMVLGWAAEVSKLLNAHVSLKAENASLKRENEKLKLALETTNALMRDVY